MKRVITAFITPLLSLVRKSVGQGASTTVYAAVHPDLQNIGGCYLSNCKIVDPLKYSEDSENCEKLWKLTEELSKEKYPF